MPFKKVSEGAQYSRNAGSTLSQRRHDDSVCIKSYLRYRAKHLTKFSNVTLETKMIHK